MSKQPRSIHSMTRTARTLTALLLAAACASADLAAQEEGDAQRGGVHFSIGAGAASMSVSCPGCGTDFFENRLSGFSGMLQLGGMVTPRFAIAGEFMGWISNEAPIYRRVAGLSVVFLGYPSASSGFFVKGGFGGVRAIAEDDFVLIQTDAFLSVSGVGVDVPVGSTMVTPYANYVWSFLGETWVNGNVSPVVAHPNAFQFGVALTVH